jgi:vacuolar-type H+-ATPase subunit H
MCYNCGCGMPNNDMGKKENITNKTLEEAAKVMNQPVKDAKQNALELLKKVLAVAKESQDKNWKP